MSTSTPMSFKSRQNPTISLLARAQSPTSTARIFADKINHRPLYLSPNTNITTPNLLNTTSSNLTSFPPANAQIARRLARAKKKSLKKIKPKPLSSRQKRTLGLYDIPAKQQNYDLYLGLHQLWVGYMQDLLCLCPPSPSSSGNTVRPADMAQKLSSADYHGAEMEVARSRCVDRVGIRGIVVRDEKRAFVLVSKGGKTKCVPKEGTIFRVWVPVPVGNSIQGHDDMAAEVQNREISKECRDGESPNHPKPLIFELHGDQFMYRAVDRANKKFKLHFLSDL